MIHILIFSTGKTKERWLIDAITEYQKRLQKEVIITWHIEKDLTQIEKKLIDTRYVLLDLHGHSFSSEAFADWFEKQLHEHGATIRFVIGDDSGVSAKLRKEATLCWQLSELTFTHQICRLLLVEQIYRAISLLQGKKYHK